MQLDLYMPGTLDSQLASVEQTAAIAIRRKSDRIVSARRLEAGKAGSISALASGKESLEGFIDSAQHVLAAREVRQCQAAICAHRLQLIRLIVVIDRRATNLPGSDALLERCIVEAGRISEFSIEELDLWLSWVDSVLESEAQYLPSLYRDNTNV